MVKGYQKAASNEQEDKEANHPLKTADILSILTFSWLNVLFKTGSKRPLDEGDFLPLNEDNDTRVWTEHLKTQ